MFMDDLGICHEKVAFIPDGTVLEEGFHVKVWKITESGVELAAVTDEQDNSPSEDQITWAIAYHKGTYATVEKVFYLSKIPFTEEAE